MKSERASERKNGSFKKIIDKIVLNTMAKEYDADISSRFPILIAKTLKMAPVITPIIPKIQEIIQNIGLAFNFSSFSRLA